MESENECVIGIDPDLKKSGICMLDKKGDIFLLLEWSIAELTMFLADNKKLNYVIEDVLKNKATYNRGVNAKANTRISQNVGMVKGAASLIIELIEHHTGKPPMLAPAGVGKQLKNNANLFKNVTGYQGRTNEDKRDAYAVAMWGFDKVKRAAK